MSPVARSTLSNSGNPRGSSIFAGQSFWIVGSEEQKMELSRIIKAKGGLLSSSIHLATRIIFTNPINIDKTMIPEIIKQYNQAEQMNGYTGNCLCLSEDWIHISIQGNRILDFNGYLVGKGDLFNEAFWVSKRKEYMKVTNEKDISTYSDDELMSDLNSDSDTDDNMNGGVLVNKRDNDHRKNSDQPLPRTSIHKPTNPKSISINLKSSENTLSSSPSLASSLLKSHHKPRNSNRSEKYIRSTHSDVIIRDPPCQRCKNDGFVCLGPKGFPYHKRKCYTCATGRCSHYGSVPMPKPKV